MMLMTMKGLPTCNVEAGQHQSRGLVMATAAGEVVAISNAPLPNARTQFNTETARLQEGAFDAMSVTALLHSCEQPFFPWATNRLRSRKQNEVWPGGVFLEKQGGCMGQQELKLAGRSSETPRKRKCTEAMSLSNMAGSTTTPPRVSGVDKLVTLRSGFGGMCNGIYKRLCKKDNLIHRLRGPVLDSLASQKAKMQGGWQPSSRSRFCSST